MKLVLDTNILFSLFKKDSYARKIIKNYDLELISPEFSLIELEKHSEIIMRKSGINKNEFKITIEELKAIITFISEEKYIQEIKNAAKLAEKLDKKDKTEFLQDIDFMALALTEKCALWSNDKLLKKQSKVKIVHSEEIEKFLK